MQSLQEIEQILINAKINPNAEFSLNTDEYVYSPPSSPHRPPRAPARGGPVWLSSTHFTSLLH
jgi:hypothetical protein